MFDFLSKPKFSKAVTNSVVIIKEVIIGDQGWRSKDGTRPPMLTGFRRQCGPVVRALALRSGDPGFKTSSDHSLNLFLVVPGATSQLHL